MREKALRPLRVEIPKSDEPPTGAVLVVGVVAFVVGIAWPRLAGIQLGPSAPSTAVAPSTASTVEPTDLPKPMNSVKAVEPVQSATASPLGAPMAPTASEALEPVVNVRRGVILSCKGANGERKGRECGDLVGFDEIAMPKIRGLSKCPQAKGLSGKLSVLLDLDFTREKISVHFGKSSTVGNEFSLGHCLRIALESAKLGKVQHAHDRYSVAYNASFEEPGTLSPATPTAASATPSATASSATASSATAPSVTSSMGEKVAPKDGVDKTRGRVEWEVAIIRDAPKTGTIVARLPKGSSVRLGPTKEGWISVGYGDGFSQSGWVYRGALAQ